MAVRWIESFDHDFGDTASVTQKGWTIVSGSWQTTGGRWQGTAMRNNNPTPGVFKTPNLGNQGTWILGMSFRMASFSGSFSETKIAALFNAANEQISLWVVGTSGQYQFRVKRGSTTMATSSKLIRSGFWITVEWKVVLDTNGSNGSVEVKLNEISELLVENTDTTDHASTVANALQIEASNPSGGNEMHFDDLWLLDGTGGALDNYLGDRIVEGKLPTADGNRNQWTIKPGGGGSHVGQVSEAIIDNDSSYLYVLDTADNLVELFVWPDVNAIASAINAVFLYFDLRIDTNASDKVRPIFRNGGGTEDTGTEVTIDEDQAYKRFTEIFLQDPTIDAAWTPSNWNAMQVGLESRAV